MKKLFGVLCGVILAVSGLLLTACGDPYKNMKIVTDFTSLEMIVGEERQLTVSVEGTPNGVSNEVNLSPDGEFITILSSEKLSAGRTRFTIKALTSGEGSITIRTLEGGKTLDIYVNVSENIENFVRNSTNAFVVRENGFEMDLSPKKLFTFTPSSSVQTDLNYFYTVGDTDYQVSKIVSENIIENDEEVLYVRIYTLTGDIFNINENTFTLKAISVFNSSLEQTFTVDVIENISVNKLQLTAQGGLEIVNPSIILPKGQEPTGDEETEVLNEIKLVSNDSSRANVEVELVLNSTTENVEVSVKTGFSIVEIEETTLNSFKFKLQAVYVGEDTLTVTLNYIDYEGYSVVLEYVIQIVSAPNSVKVNELDDGEIIQLYDVNYNVSIASVNLTPMVFSTDSTFTQISIDFCDINGNRIDNWSEYLTLSYQNITRNPDENGYVILPSADFENNVLISPITLLGKKVYDGENGIYIRFEVLSQYLSEEKVQNVYQINIVPGAKDFEVNYPNGQDVLYLDLNDEEQVKIFEDFNITEGAYWGLFTYRYSNASYFTVEQIIENGEPQLALKITPISVGSGGKVTIYLPNGRSAELRVNVEASVKSSSFGIETNDNIVKFQEDETNKNTFYLTLMDKGDSLETLFKYIATPSMATLYSGEASIAIYNENEIDLDYEYSGYSDTLSIIPTILDGYISEFTINLTISLGKIQDFKIISENETITYTIIVTVYIPIKNLSFQQDVSGNLQSVTNLPIYNLDTASSNGVGYYYGIKNRYSKVLVYPAVTLFSGVTLVGTELLKYITSVDKNNSYSFKTSIMSGNLTLVDGEQFAIQGDETAYSTGLINFGSYNINQNDLSLRIICNSGDISGPGSKYWFSFNLNLLGIDYYALLNLELQSFTRLDSIGLYNYQKTIYLDDRNPSYSSGYFLNPSETDCTDFDLKFVPDDPNTTNINIISTVKTDDQITIYYNSAYGGGSGRLYFIPKDWYTTEEDEANIDQALGLQYITIVASDGTEEHPIYINSAEEFIEIASNSESLGEDKNYAISTVLDFSGINLTTFGVLRGTIRGIGSSAGLTNLNITTPTTIGENAYLGLFAYVEEGATIENLSITAKLAVSTSAKYIGVVCGENKGTLSNLSVKLLNDYTNSKEMLSITSQENVYVGIIAGNSSGTIFNSNGNGLVNVTDVFYVDSVALLDDVGVYVGGVVGHNSGKIILDDSNYSVNAEKDFTFKGIIQTSNTKAVGGVAGINAGTTSDENFGLLSGLKISGKIIANVNNNEGDNVGGIVGLNAFNLNNQDLTGKVVNCLTRAYVEAGNYVGGIAGKNSYSRGDGTGTTTITGNILNNTIQLAYNGIFSELINARVGDYAFTFAGDDKEESLALNNSAYYYKEFTSEIGAIKYINTSSGAQEFKNGSFEFKEETIEIDKLNSNLISNEEDIDFVSLMFYYLANNSAQQSLITSLNTQTFPIKFLESENITLTSNNSKILTFDENGNAKIWGTGLVQITATSILNTEVKKSVYVYVTNFIDEFKVSLNNGTYLSNNGSYIGIELNKSLQLNLEYTASDITEIGGELITDEYGIPISIELVKNTEFTADVSLKLENGNISPITSSISNQTIILQANQDEDEISNLTITPKFEFVVNGNSYSINFENILKNDIEFNSMVVVEKGTTKLLLNTAEISVEPNDEFNISIEWETDDINDYLEISYAKISDTGINNDYFKILSSSLQSKKLTDERVVYSYDKNVSTTFTFKYNLDSFSSNYEGVYYINFTAKNGYRQTLIVNIKTQTVSNITYKNYYDIDITNFDEKAEPLNDISPDGNNLLEVLVYPSISDFDYIEVTNAETNYANGNNAVFSLSKIETIGDNKRVVDVFGAESIDGGIRIQKSQIGSDGKIYIKYNISSSATDGSTATFNIIAYKNGEIQKSTSCNVEVRIKDGVYVTIIGKENAIQGESILVARGLTYNLDVQIKGFTEDEVYFDSTNSQYASINKTNNGFVLNINSNINYAQDESVGYAVEIDCYGEKIIDGRVYTSGIRTLKLMIVDYVILSNNIVPYSYIENNQNANIVIKNSEAEAINVAIGNRTDLNIGFVYGSTIEYNTQDANTVQKVSALEQTLAQNGKWYITDKSTGEKVELNNNSLLPSNMYYRIEYNNSTNLYSIIPLYINSANNPNYYLSFEVYYKYKNGGVQIVNDNIEDYENFNTDFLIEAYQSGNENNEIPISNYEEFVSMQAGAYYILLNDITLEEGFTPISTPIAGLNGNGHTITFRANWSIDGLQYSGLFETISENAIVKNLKLAFNNTANTNITITNENDASYFGFLAGRNLGVITNCEIVSTNNNVYVSMNPNTITTTYVAGLVGLNEGYITNSRVATNLVVRRSNLAGFVAVNDGSIASSYVKNSNLTNESTISSTNKTAGFVIDNGVSITQDAQIGGLENAQILTSYVSGTCTSYIYADETNKIWSNVEVSGFVYNNLGAISDCYSNMPINSQSVRAGFAFNNSGLIQNSYSTSTFLNQNRQTDYGFVYTNSYSNQTGKILDCKYLLGNKNNGIFVSNISGLQALTELDFSNQNYFSTFAMSDQTEKTKGVWFYPSANEEVDFKLNGVSQKFTYGRPELVAPNIIVNTSQVLESSTTDTSTGEEIYQYSGGEEQGSKYNPYIITSAKNFESLILETNVNSKNNKYYRFVKNIDYVDEGLLSSSLYKTTFIGDIEGNGMTISGLVIDTRETLNYGGLFAKVGEGVAYVGSIKNLNLKPKYINMPNTSAVGTVAGSLESGLLFNVKVDGFDYDSSGIVIVGRNIVGGLVGIAKNTYKLYNVESSVSASATYRSINYGNSFKFYSPYSSSISNVSYAGVIAGVIEGEGIVRYANVSDLARALGEVVGLYFGRIGTNSNVSNLEINLLSGQYINAAYYGGILAGEIAGVVNNITITGSTTNFFRYVPSVPSAVGGIAGYMSNGMLQNVNVYVDLIFPNIEVVGGVVGEMIGGTISNAHKTGNITAMGIAGGIVGYMNEQCASDDTVSKQNITIENSTVTNGKILVRNDNYLSAYVGGIVGINEYKFNFNENGYINESDESKYPEREIVNCYAEVDLEINSTMYNGLMTASMGGLVGASYQDKTRTQNTTSGLAIYNNDFKSIYMPNSSISEDYETNNGEDVYFNSRCTYTISITNYRDGGQVNVYFGGIIGLGGAYKNVLTMYENGYMYSENNELYYYFDNDTGNNNQYKNLSNSTSSVINIENIWGTIGANKYIKENDCGSTNNKNLVKIKNN